MPKSKDRSYRGGHFFSRIPLCSKKETDQAAKAGFIPWRWKNSTFYVFKKDPKPTSANSTGANGNPPSPKATADKKVVVKRVRGGVVVRDWRR